MASEDVRRYRCQATMNFASSEQVYETRGIKIPANSLIPEDWMSHRLDEYEFAEAHVVEARLESADVVMELGTGMGFISSLCAKRIGSARVFTFEANQLLEPVIRQVFSLNDVSPELNFCLLSHTTGEQTFYAADDFLCSSVIRPSSNSKELLVQKRLFNEEVQRIKPTFLIVDIEGGEHDLFINADLSSVRKILVEIHGTVLGEQKRAAIFKNFAELGFVEDKRVTREACSKRRQLYLALMDIVGDRVSQSVVRMFGLKARVGIDETHFFVRRSL